MTILSASGDDGSEDCYPTPPTLQVDDPASQPFVTGVGGTTLSENSDRRPPGRDRVERRARDRRQRRRRLDASGRCPATSPGAPSFLHVINANSSGTPCAAPSGDCREVPDVSADGDPHTGYVIYWNGQQHGRARRQPVGWQVVGGTSAAAPAWAALIALTNASARCAGAPIGFANPALYHAGRHRLLDRLQRHHVRQQRHDRAQRRAVPGRLGIRHGDRARLPERHRACRDAVHGRDLPRQPRCAALDGEQHASASDQGARHARRGRRPTRPPDCRAGCRSTPRPARSPAARTGSGRPP